MRNKEIMDIKYRAPALDEMEKLSEQIRISYVSAYKGLMEDKYLASLKADYWIPILQESEQLGDTCLIAELDGVIIGSTVFGTAYDGKEQFAQWHAFYLLPQYIGLGIGHLFCQKIEAEMIMQGCKYCILEVLSSNNRAVQFYLSHGFYKTETFDVEENEMTLSCDKMTKSLKELTYGL
jgi:ribosomal protein S18 acetylase RimI-like enzyme